MCRGLAPTLLFWTEFQVLISKSSILLMCVGFLLVIPKPITNPATVYKGFKKLKT